MTEPLWNGVDDGWIEGGEPVMRRFMHAPSIADCARADPHEHVGSIEDDDGPMIRWLARGFPFILMEPGHTLFIRRDERGWYVAVTDTENQLVSANDVDLGAALKRLVVDFEREMAAQIVPSDGPDDFDF